MAREQLQTLTEPMYYILLALLEECCGVDIMEKVKELSGGRVRVGPGTLYAMLGRHPAHQGRGTAQVLPHHGRRAGDAAEGV